MHLAHADPATDVGLAVLSEEAYFDEVPFSILQRYEEAVDQIARLDALEIEIDRARLSVVVFVVAMTAT